VLGGAALVFTAIGHPNGMAPAFQEMFRHLGNWLLRARRPEWTAVIKQLGPAFVIGAVLGFVIWPLRVDSYSVVWMPLLGGIIGLIMRVIILGVRRSIIAKRDKRRRRAHQVATRRIASPITVPAAADAPHATLASAERF
jgi:hypothetical protein